MFNSRYIPQILLKTLFLTLHEFHTTVVSFDIPMTQSLMSAKFRPFTLLMI